VPLVKALNHQVDCTLRQEQQVHLVLAASPLRNFSRLSAPPLHLEAEHRITQSSIQISGQHRVLVQQQLATRQSDFIHICEPHLLLELVRLLPTKRTPCCEQRRLQVVEHHQLAKFTVTSEPVQHLAYLIAMRHSGTENLELQPVMEGQLLETKQSVSILPQEQQQGMDKAPKVFRRLKPFQERQALLVRVHNLQMVYMLHQEPLLLQLLVQVQQVNSRFCSEPLSHLEHLVKLRLENTLLREEQQLQAEQPRATKHLDYTSLHVQQMEAVRVHSSQLSCEQYIEMLWGQVLVARAIQPYIATSVRRPQRAEQQQMTRRSRFTPTCDKRLEAVNLARRQTAYTLRLEQPKHLVARLPGTRRLACIRRHEPLPALACREVRQRTTRTQ
jgi:hypothetical protein